MLGIVSKGIIIGVLVSADVIYAALTCLGMGVVVNFVEANQAPLQLIGSIVLGIFGYYIFQSNPTRNLKKHREKKLSFTQDFITAFLLTFSNVLIVLLYIGHCLHRVRGRSLVVRHNIYYWKTEKMVQR